MNVRTLLVALSAFTLFACESKTTEVPDPPAETESTEAKPTEEGTTPKDEAKTSEAKKEAGPAFINPFERSKRKSMASEAMSMTRKMTDGARAYMVSEQRITGPDGNQPWHEGEMIGMPVAVDAYVFPGGANFSFSTHDEVPKGGKKAKTTFDAADKAIAAMLDRSYVTIEPETYFRYTYTTGPGVGKDATLTIKAEADFDPASPQIHTVTYEVTVNDDYEAVVGEEVVTGEFQ